MLGSINLSGTFDVRDRYGNPQPAPWMTLVVWDEDGVGDDDIKAEVVLGPDGSFSIDSMRNRDGDDNDPDQRLDLYFQFKTQGPDILVSDTGRDVHKWRTDTYHNIADGSHFFDFYLPSGSLNEPAAWIWLDTIWSWDYVHGEVGQAPGDVAIRWQDGRNTLLPCIDNSCFLPIYPINGVFISDAQIVSADIVRHEVGHHLMYRARGNDFWFDLNDLEDWIACVITGHSFFEATTPRCAHTEGWASFIAIATDGESTDSCYDFGLGPCSGINVDLEAANRNDGRNIGDDVEARSAATYLDLVDSANEGMDHAEYPFLWVWWSTATQEVPSEFWGYWYWHYWQYRHYPIQALYWNGIDYNALPIVAVPDMQFPVSSRAVNLCSFVSDHESTDDELDWVLGFTQGTQCNVLLQSYTLDVNPTGSGYCLIGIEVTDGIGIAADLFRIDFSGSPPPTPGPYGVFLPAIHSTNMASGC